MKEESKKSINREALLLAISEDELHMFLEGRGLYRLGYNPYSPGESMLNLEPAMAEIYSYYKEMNNSDIDRVLENTLLKLMQYKSGDGVYEVFSVISYQLRMEIRGISPFEIDKSKLIGELRKYALKYEDKLKAIRKYEGDRFGEGLWEAMKKENELNIKKYGIKIL